MEKDKKISFKPLHEGMGFHPFSDGLPYAPESKSKYNGTGATAAGRPQFAKQMEGPALAQATSNAPKVTARQLQERNAAPPAQMVIKSHEPIFRSHQPTEKAPAMIHFAAPHIDAKALLRRRAFAYLLDMVIHAGFWLSINLAALLLFKVQIDMDIVKDNFSQFLIFFFVSQWLFVALQEILFENSLGKVFFNLEFKRNHRSLFIRSVVFMVSALCLGAGFFYRPQDQFGAIQLKSKQYA